MPNISRIGSYLTEILIFPILTTGMVDVTIFNIALTASLTLGIIMPNFRVIGQWVSKCIKGRQTYFALYILD
jgi:hypothetical protein